MIRCSILCKYFETVIKKNKYIKSAKKLSKEHAQVISNYKKFLISLNAIVFKRKSTLLNKQVNLFTTNIDIFLEKALELTQVEYNDGFYGRFSPIFNLTNFKKSIFQKTLHYDNTSEIPVFNLLKVHGSLTWVLKDECICYSELAQLEEISEKHEAVKGEIIEVTETDTLADLISAASDILYQPIHEEFLTTYQRLAIVNPLKEKFRDTLLNLHYYELLRIFSNELEKENTLLFVLGFSMADEHIRQIVTRAANSNPTLLIIIYAYDSTGKDDIKNRLESGGIVFRYDNIKIECLDDGNYDFSTLNEKVFSALLNNID